VTSPQSPVPPRPREGGAGTACAHVAAAGRRCATEGCGHGEELHNLTDDKRRTGCSVSTGANATPCGCRTFTPEVS
jgi:hypothetical protein